MTLSPIEEPLTSPNTIQSPPEESKLPKIKQTLNKKVSQSQLDENEDVVQHQKSLFDKTPKQKFNMNKTQKTLGKVDTFNAFA